MTMIFKRFAHADRAKGVTAVLGPTNTGKTHLAIERMLAHGGKAYVHSRANDHLRNRESAARIR